MASTPNDGKLRTGQDYIVQDDITAPYTEQMVHDVNLSAKLTLGVDAQPVQEDSTKVKIYDLSAIHTAYLAEVVVLPTKVTFQLPPLLTGFVTTIEKQHGDGSTAFTGAAVALGTHVNIAMSPRVEGTGSAAIMPDVSATITEPWLNDRDAYEALLFALDNFSKESLLQRVTTQLISNAIITGTTVTITVASPGVVTWNAHGMSNGDTFLLHTTGVLPTGLSTDTLYYLVNKAANTFQLSLTSGGAAINTTGSQSGTHTGYKAVRPWPNFKPEAINLVITGQSASISTNASFQQQVNVEATNVSLAWGEGTGITKQIGLTVKSVRIPPCLHGTIAFVFPLDTETVTSSATVSVGSGTNWPARSADTGVITQTLSASVSPNGIGATTPATYPTSGLYLQNIDASAYNYGLNRVRAIIFDFATIA